MNKYSVSQLAKIIGVPRTTINDWLNRYSQYIDFKIQGKRKIYLDSTLDVLKEIAQLREDGLSSFDIEDELEKRHPVHGEVTTPEEIEPQDHQPQTQVDSAAPEAAQPPAESREIIVQNNSEEFALIAKKQSDELAQLLTEHLRNMTQRIEDIEELNRANSAKTQRKYLMSAVAFFMLVVIGGVIAAMNFNNLTELKKSKDKLNDSHQKLASDYSVLSDNLDKHTKTNQALQLKNEKMSKNIAKTSNELNLTKQQLTTVLKKSDELKSTLEEQKHSFNSMLKQEKAERQKTEAELLRIRDQYANKMLKQLKQLTDTTAKGAEKDQIIAKMQKQIEEQKRQLETLNKPEPAKETEKADKQSSKNNGAKKLEATTKELESAIKPVKKKNLAKEAAAKKSAVQAETEKKKSVELL